MYYWSLNTIALHSLSQVAISHFINPFEAVLAWEETAAM
jgi:hypothetical protein